jgi:hypothetical protein
VDPDDEDDEGCEEEPLGTDDDISDEDASDLFDTENVSGLIVPKGRERNPPPCPSPGAR